MHSNAGRTDLDRHIHPLLAVGDRLAAPRSIPIIEAVWAINRDIHYPRICLFQSLPKTSEIGGVKRTKMPAVRLDVVDIEFFCHLGCKSREIHPRELGITIPVGGTLNEGAKRI